MMNRRLRGIVRPHRRLPGAGWLALMVGVVAVSCIDVGHEAETGCLVDRTLPGCALPDDGEGGAGGIIVRPSVPVPGGSGGTATGGAATGGATAAGDSATGGAPPIL